MLNICGVLNYLSYGNVCSGFTYGCIKQGYPISLFPINKYQQYQVHQKYQQYIKQALDNSKLYNCNSPCVRIWHQNEMTEFVGKRRVGFPIFELDRFSDHEKHHLNSCDSILVASEWAKQIIYKETKHKAKVVPLGVDSEIFYPQKNRQDEKTIFLVHGKWEIRKAHDICHILFNKAFSYMDDVELWVMCTNAFMTKEEDMAWKNLYLNTPLGKAQKIKFVPWCNTQEDVAAIYREVDCGLSISRAEGWDLPLLEMMSCGKKNIVTNYSGHTQFCNNDNSFLVDITELEDAYDGIWFHNNGRWAHLGKQQQEQIIEYMRYVHKSPKELNKFCLATSIEHDWTISSLKLLQSLEIY